MANSKITVAFWTAVPLLLGAIGGKLIWGQKKQAERAAEEAGSANAESGLGNITGSGAPTGNSGPLPPSYDTWDASQMPDRPGKNFSWDEFSYSATAAARGISNALTLGQKRNILWGVEFVLQPIRDAIGLAVSITGGTRSAALNSALGGAEDSQHMSGQAVDIKVAGYQARALFDFILRLGLPFDQLIWYDETVGSVNKPRSAGHVHISWRPNGQPRRQRLHAIQGQTKTEYLTA